MANPSSPSWHALSIEETLTRLSSAHCGLTSAEAARRLSAVGSLVLTAPAQGVIMAASALTPTNAITRFML